MGKRKQSRNRRHETPAPDNTGDEVDEGAAPEPMTEANYFRERSMLIDLETKSSESHDRAALTLSAGALALSLTFIRDFAPSPIAGTLWMIGLAWAAFIVSISAVLFSFHMSQKACRRQRQVIDEIHETGDRSGVDEANSYSLWTERANYVSFLAFLAGVISLAAFGFTNLPHGMDQ